MTPEEYEFRSDSETIVEKWHTVLPDGNTYEEAVDREPVDREWFLTTYAELLTMGAQPSFTPPAAATEAVLIRIRTRYITEATGIDRRPMPELTGPEGA